VRVLLDSCVPKGLLRSLAGHEVRTAPGMGGGDLDNGDLLDAMEGHFDALLIVDRRLPLQQHIRGRSFGIVVLRTKSNRLADLVPLVPALLAALGVLRPGEVREIGAPRGP
jgi:hypothetical protein